MILVRLLIALLEISVSTKGWTRYRAPRHRYYTINTASKIVYKNAALMVKYT